MTLLGRFAKRALGALTGNRQQRRAAGRRRVRASYDTAQTTGENENHWAYADGLNANAANDPATRQTLRERAQYEADNNGYVVGLVDKLGNDLVGRVPRPQLRIPGVGRDVTRAIERAFLSWARLVGLGSKLRLMDNAAVVRGESFGVLINNPELPADGVQLDLRLYETDQVSTPWYDWSDPLAFDGGRLDQAGNVSEWHFLKTHPGSNVWVANWLQYDVLPAREVIHWFKPRRAGQVRGVPEILSSLTLYGYLRRYTLATLVAAETAANLAGVLETDTAADAGDGPTFATMDEVELARGSLITLPANWKASQFRAEQPVTGYGAFKTELLTEAGQPVGAPQNVSTGSSAAYNYSSGRLDYGIYHRGVGVRRSDFRDRVLDRVFRAWLDEAALVPGLIPDGLPLRNRWTWEWYFDGFTSLDPQKDATADKTRLESGTTTLQRICAEEGEDWEEVLEQQAREAEYRKSLRRPEATAAVPATVPGSNAAPAAGSPAAAGLTDSQVSTLLKIIDRVATDQLTPAAAVAIIRVSFPNMAPATVADLVNSVKGEPASAV
jgi:lambda family phage portal protein